MAGEVTEANTFLDLIAKQVKINSGGPVWCLVGLVGGFWLGWLVFWLVGFGWVGFGWVGLVGCLVGWLLLSFMVVLLACCFDDGRSLPSGGLDEERV